LGGVLFFLVLQLQVVSGYSALEAGITMLPFTLLMLAFSAKAGELGDRIGPRWPLAVGGLLSAIGVFLLMGVGANAPYLTAVLPGVLILSVGMTITVAPLTAGVLAAVEVSHAGVASGINNAIARAAGLVAVAALPLIAGLSGNAYNDPAAFALGYQIAIGVCSLLYLIAAVIALVAVRSRRRKKVERAARTQCPYNAPQLDPGVEAR